MIDWPLREVLVTCLARARQAELEDYRTAVLVWATQRPFQKDQTPPPAVPELLRDP